MADIKIKNRQGQDVTYTNIDTITFPLASGSGVAEFREGGGAPSYAERSDDMSSGKTSIEFNNLAGEPKWFAAIADANNISLTTQYHYSFAMYYDGTTIAGLGLYSNKIYTYTGTSNYTFAFDASTNKLTITCANTNTSGYVLAGTYKLIYGI